MTTPSIDIVIYIAARADLVWNALTDPEITPRYWGGTRIESDWQVGSRIRYRRDGAVVDEHTLLEIDPPRRLRHSFQPLFDEALRREKPSRVTIELAPGEVAAAGGVTRLHLLHDEFGENSKVYAACREGWPMILSGLKTLLETGRPMPAFKPR